jgi:hypothetical protein
LGELLAAIESGVCTACEGISFPQEYDSVRMIPKAATGSMADGLGKVESKIPNTLLPEAC